MQKAIKNFINASLFGSIAMIVLGVLFLIFPDGALDVFRWIIAILAFLSGLFIVVGELSKKYSMPFFGATAIGVIFIVVGIFFAANPTSISILAIILGVWFIVMALSSLRFSVALSGGSAFISTLMSIVALIVGILMIVNPWGGSISMMIVLGAGLLVFGISACLNVLVFKNNAKDLEKKLKKYVKPAKTKK